MRAPASVLHRAALATTGPGEPSSSPVSMKASEQQQKHQQTAPVMAVNSDIVVILASLLCALVLALGIAIVTRCACSRRRRSANSPPPPKGLKKKAIDALPTISFAADAASSPQSSSSSSECAICLAEFTEGEGLRVLPQCGHGFHVACVDAWLRTCATCPSCRAPIVATPTVAAANNRCERCGEVAAPNGGVEDMSSLTPFSSFSAF